MIVTAICAVLVVTQCLFCYIDSSGPYGVGHRQKVLLGERSVQVSVYYPIKRDVYEMYKMDPSRTSLSRIDGIDDVKEFANIYNKSYLWFRDHLYYRLRAINDEKIHDDFVNGNKKLTPVIFSH